MRVSRFFVGAPGRPETLFRLVFFIRHPSFGGGQGPLRGHHWKGPGCSGLLGPAISAAWLGRFVRRSRRFALVLLLQNDLCVIRSVRNSGLDGFV